LSKVKLAVFGNVLDSILIGHASPPPPTE
jgi:hypothetical protein